MAGRMVSRETVLSPDWRKLKPDGRGLWPIMIALANDQGIASGDARYWFDVYTAPFRSPSVARIEQILDQMEALGMIARCTPDAGSMRADCTQDARSVQAEVRKFVRLLNWDLWQRIKMPRRDTRNTNKPKGKEENTRGVGISTEHLYPDRRVGAGTPPGIRTTPDNGTHPNAEGTLRQLTTDELRSPRQLRKRFEEAVLSGLIHDSEQQRINFFAAAHLTCRLRRIDNPPGFFIDFLRRKRWESLTAADESWASRAIKEAF